MFNGYKYFPYLQLSYPISPFLVEHFVIVLLRKNCLKITGVLQTSEHEAFALK